MPILLPARSELLACRHLVNLAWCILALAPIQELRRRIAELDAADGVNATFVDRAAERDGLASQLNAARSVGAVAVRVLVGRLKDNIGLPWLSGQMLHFDWACWWELVRECPLGEVERRDATLQ